MECAYIPSAHWRHTQIYRFFSVTSFISFFLFDNIRTMGESRPEYYDFWQFFYLKEGSARYITEDGTEYPVEAGQIIFRAPFHSSRVIYNMDSHNVVYIVSFECSSTAMNCFARAPEKLYGEEVELLMETISSGIRIFETVRPNGDVAGGLRLRPDVPTSMVNYCAACMEHFLNMLYCRFTQAKYYHDEGEKINQRIRENRLVSEIKQFLYDHIAGNPSIEEIAAQFHMNPVTLMKLFKRETSCSIIHYLNTLKTDEAMRMISQTSMNFTEIADALGFSSVNYFSRVFKNRLGLTPTEFARRQSKPRNLGQ